MIELCNKTKSNPPVELTSSCLSHKNLLVWNGNVTDKGKSIKIHFHHILKLNNWTLVVRNQTFRKEHLIVNSLNQLGTDFLESRKTSVRLTGEKSMKVVDWL